MRNPTSGPTSHPDKLRHYLNALETGTFNEITDLFAPGMAMQQLPNRI